MLKKFFITFSAIILSIVIICGNVNAADLETTLNVIQQSSEIKRLENDQGYISKTIVDSNAETGEVTIELKLSNTAKQTEEVIETEVMFVIDNSPSMEYKSEDGTIRKDNVINAAKSLTEKLFANSETVKIGMLKFSGGTTLSSATKVMCNLTDDEDTVIKSLDTLANQSTTGGTNILAGITKANNTFSSTCANKIIILLTDGVPNYDLSGNSNPSSDEKKQEVYTNTKNGLITINNSGTYIISMMTGIASSAEDSEDIEVIEEIFGTQTLPTVGSFYNISDSDINKIVTEDIYSEVISKIQNPINTVKIVDYFPEDITENFEFSYVGNPSIGTVSEGIDEETRTISWDIGTLKGDEVATLKYKLKIKDMKNTELLNKTIATNEKVKLTYTDTNEKEYEVILTSSPKIQLSEKLIETQGNTDATTANTILPQAGINITIIFSLIAIIMISIIIYKKCNDYKDVK